MSATDLKILRTVSLSFRATTLACSAEVAVLGAVEGCFCVSLENGKVASLDGGEKRIPTSCAALGRVLAFGCSDNSVSVYRAEENINAFTQTHFLVAPEAGREGRSQVSAVDIVIANGQLLVCAAQLYGPARVFRVCPDHAELLFETAPFFAQTLALRVIGRMLFVAGQNKEVRVYDILAGRPVQTLGRDCEGGCGVLEISAYSDAEQKTCSNSCTGPDQKLGPDDSEIVLALLGELGRHVLIRLSANGEARMCENQLLGVATERGPT